MRRDRTSNIQKHHRSVTRQRLGQQKVHQPRHLRTLRQSCHLGQNLHPHRLQRPQLWHQSCKRDQKVGQVCRQASRGPRLRQRRLLLSQIPFSSLNPRQVQQAMLLHRPLRTRVTLRLQMTRKPCGVFSSINQTLQVSSLPESKQPSRRHLQR